MINVMKILGLLAVCGTAIAVCGMWFSTVDASNKASAVAYENCVKQQYHMTPIAWYEQHQEYPACGN